MARPWFVPVHDRGQVLADVTTMIPDGGEAIADIDVLRHQGQVLGPVASAPASAGETEITAGPPPSMTVWLAR